MAVKRLTQRLIDAQEYKGRTEFIRDAKTPGLILAVNKTSMTYKVQADLWQRRKLVKTVRHTMGTTERLTLAQARTRAQEVLADIRRGIDPNDPGVPLDPTAIANWSLGKLWDTYEQDLVRRKMSARTIGDFRANLDRYLADWRDLPLSSITNSMCLTRFNQITDNSGPSAANHILSSLSTAWRRAAAPRSDHNDAVPLQANPAANILRNPTKARSNVVLPADLPAWWAATQALGNPVRRCMHRFGLFSGLRPGNLMTIERAWIDIPGRSIYFPAEVMKRRERFALPLSGTMVALVEDALAAGDMLYPGTRYLFPAKGGGPTAVVRERTMPGRTGHLLRRTHKTMALVAGISDLKSALLLDHKLGNISDVYTSAEAMHDDLVAQQEFVSAHILETAEANV